MRIPGEILGSSLEGWLPKAAFIMVMVVLPAAMPAASHASEAELKAEIDKVWAKLANLDPSVGNIDVAPAAPNWADRVKISGLVEAEAGIIDDDFSGTEQDHAGVTVELGVEAAVSDYSSAQVLFLYEDGDEGLLVDEAFIRLGKLEKTPLHLTGGRFYVPFGNFETQMISDPLTLEIGEAGEEAVLAGFEAAGLYASVYAFNGDTDDGNSDVVEHFGANAGFAFESDAVNFDVGGGWISSIRDTDGLTDALGGGPVLVAEYIDGYAAHLVGRFGPVVLIGEYVGAGDDLNGAGSNSRISAYNVEAGLLFPLAGRSVSIGGGYQETDEALWAGFAKKRMAATLAVEIMDGTTLALEGLNEEDYEVADGGSGTDWNMYTLQLAAEF